MGVTFRLYDSSMSRTVQIFYTDRDIENHRREWTAELAATVPDPVIGRRVGRRCDVSLAAWRALLAAAARNALPHVRGDEGIPDDVLTQLHDRVMSFALALEQHTDAMPWLVEVHLLRDDLARIRFEADTTVSFRLDPAAVRRDSDQ